RIVPLNKFSDATHAELSARAEGYDTSDPFDVFIKTADLPEETRQRDASNRLYALRESMDAEGYNAMLAELDAGGLLIPDGKAVRANLTGAEFAEMNAIMDRHAAPQPTGR